MKTMKKLFLLLPVALAMLVTGCLKDADQVPLVPLGAVESLDNIPGFDTLSAFIQDTISMDGDPISLPHGGYPPDIQGEFVFSDFELLSSNIQIQNDPYLNKSLSFRFGGEPNTYYQVVPLSDTLWVDTAIIIPQDTTINYHFYHQGDTLFVPVVDTIVSYQDTIPIYVYTGQHYGTITCEIYGDVPEKDKYTIKKDGNGTLVGNEEEFAICFTINYKGVINPDTGKKFTLTRGYYIKGYVDEGEILDAWLAYVNINSSLPALEDQIFVYHVGSLVKSIWTDNLPQ